MVTRYVQMICNHLYSEDYIPTPGRQQFEVIKAFAKTGMVKETTGAAFLREAGITNASSMSRVINALSGKQFIIQNEGHWRLYDVFLEHYLRFVAL